MKRHGGRLGISVVIPTRNRGANVVRTLQSVLANECLDECIVVDQSENDTTKRAVAPFLEDVRVTYHHYAETGISRGRNRGLEFASGDIVAFTDDDCVVPCDWLSKLTRAFESSENLGMAFGAVVNPPMTTFLGVNPTYTPRVTETVIDPMRLLDRVGIGANCAVRVSTLALAGLFDEALGAGAPGMACEEFDLAFRMVLRNIPVYLSPDFPVVHYGFRQGADVTKIKRAGLYGSGWLYRKHLQVGDFNLKRRLAWQMIKHCVSLTKMGVGEYRRGGRMISVGRAYHVLRGFWDSLPYRIDPGPVVYLEPASIRA